MERDLCVCLGFRFFLYANHSSAGSGCVLGGSGSKISLRAYAVCVFICLR
jgi:hypothetical protein